MKVETVRAVVEAARTWRARQSGLAVLFDGEASDLIAAVDAFEAAASEAHIESAEMPRKWRDVREGMEVLAPNGQWYKVGTVPPWREDDGSVRVPLLIGNKWGEFNRHPEEFVQVRITFPDPVDDAIGIIADAFPGSEVVE